MMCIEEIKELARQYNVEVSLVGTNVVFLKSLNNTWYFYLDNLQENIANRKKIYLFHQSEGKEKQHFHCQRKYGKISDLLDSISSHDQHMFIQRKKSRMELLFEKIECENKSINLNDKNSKLHNKTQKSKNKHSNSNNKSKFVS